MNRAPTRAAQAGFSSVELMISTAVFVPLLLVALNATRTSMVAADSFTDASERNARGERVGANLFDQLRSAAQDTIQAVPPGEQMLPEPLVEGAIYDNLEYRLAAGWEAGERAYTPDVDLPPMQLQLEPAVFGYEQSYEIYHLVLREGEKATVVAKDVAEMTVRRQGSTFTLSWTEGAHGHEPRVVERTVFVRTR